MKTASNILQITNNYCFYIRPSLDKEVYLVFKLPLMPIKGCCLSDHFIALCFGQMLFSKADLMTLRAEDSWVPLLS